MSMPAGYSQRVMRRRRPALLAAALLVLAAPVAAHGQAPPPQSTQLLALQRSTPVSEFDGWLLFSRWDGSAYHLATWHAGQARDLAVPTQASPFDADAGPNSSGQ